MIAAVRKEGVSSRRHCELVTLAVATSEDGALVCDREGRRVFTSDALDRLLREEAEVELLEESIDEARHALLGRLAQDGHNEQPTHSGRERGVSLVLQLRTSEMEYRISATAVTERTRSQSEPLCVVWVRRCKPRLLTAAALREQYGLTPREVRVSMLLVARLRSREIADALGISIHTARRHAEAVLRKLAVSSRNELRDRLHVDGDPT
jgi:DNA-binding CsgD family transcriptional regulator